VNLLTNGDFSDGLNGWTVKGNHSDSEVVDGEGPDGKVSRMAHIISTGRGSSSNLFTQSFDPDLVRGDTYIAEFWVKPLTLESALLLRLSLSTERNGGLYYLADFSGGTPGKQNSNDSDDVPPFIYPVESYPARPVQGDAITLLAIVTDDKSGPITAEVHWDDGTGEKTTPLLDDGLNGDGAAGDGVFGVELGAFPGNTLIRYYILATDSAGQTVRFPENTDPGTAQDPLTTHLGIYVEPPGIESDFPVYHLIVSSQNLARLASSPRVYVPGHFVADGDVFTDVLIRHRGQTSINYPKKHWKAKLNDDRSFYPPQMKDQPRTRIRNMNFQSSWGDKTFMREYLSYDMWRKLGDPHFMTWHCRIYLNGAFSGFFVYLEQPNEDFLQRNELNPRGFLWKSYGTLQGGNPSGLLLKVPNTTSGSPDVATANLALRDWAQKVAGTVTPSSELPGVISDLFDVDQFIDYQAVNVILHNCDQMAKNFLVYGDADANLWFFLPWDMDLTLGRNYICGDPRPSGQSALTNDVIWFNERYGHILFGTRQHPKCDGPWNGIHDAFFYRTSAFNDQLYRRVNELNETLLKPEILLPEIEELRVRLRDEVTADRQKSGSYGLSNSWDFDARVNDMVGYVRSRYSNLRQQLGDYVAPEPTDLSCIQNGTDAEVSWTNNSQYESVQVYLNGELVETLPGDQEQALVKINEALDLNTIRVATTYNRKERLGSSCTVISELPGYQVAIAEDFNGPPGVPLMNAAWALNGDAVHDGGRLQITPDVSGAAGSAFFRLPLPAVDFIADFDFTISGSSSGGEGMTFAWIRGDTPEALGTAGAGLGFFGLQGYSVEFDTAKSAGEADSRHVGINSTDADPSGSIASFEMAEYFEGKGIYHCRVVHKDGEIVVALSNPGIQLEPTEVLRAQSGGGDEEMFFGFTAATSTARSEHMVDNFILRIPGEITDPVRPEFTAESTTGRISTPIQFRNSTAGVGVIRYEWNFGDGETAGEENPVHIYTAGGAYDVTLTVEAASGKESITKPGFILISQPFPFIRGDGDLDGERTLTDVLVMLNHMFLEKRTDLPCLKQMDVNDSGTLEISDPIYFLAHLFQGGSPPPPPYPEPGLDPTEDEIPCEDVAPNP